MHGRNLSSTFVQLLSLAQTRSFTIKIFNPIKISFCPNLVSRHYSIQYPKLTRGMLVTTKIDTPEFHALFTPELKSLVCMFEKNNYEIRIAGGAVRDLLMGGKLHDIDFATTATPLEMKKMFETVEIRMINKKGEDHGTITARINQENFEVTTLRIDVRTDGRHAQVEFTKDWQLDASRRDLTINSMFLGFDGTIYDYFNGIDDVRNRKVRFVGDARDRIQEDFLRILRYFRFYGRIAKGSDEYEADTLKAIQENANGLAGISGERIWVELQQIVVGNHAGTIMKTMAETGVLEYMGLPKNSNIEEYMKICDRTQGLEPEPMTRIAALLSTEEQIYEVNKRLKVSADELNTCLFVVMFRNEQEDGDLLKHYQHLIVSLLGKEVKVKEKVVELLKYKGHAELLNKILEWTPPKLPVSGKDLIDRNLRKGPLFAKVLDEVRKRWIESDFTLTKEDFMSSIDQLIEKFKSEIPMKKKMKK